MRPAPRVDGHFREWEHPANYLDTFLSEERGPEDRQNRYVFREHWRVDDGRHRSCEQVWRNWTEPMKDLISAVAACGLYAVSASAQSESPKPADARVESVVRSLTLEEKNEYIGRTGKPRHEG